VVTGCEQLVLSARLGKQFGPKAQLDDRVDPRVHGVDVIEVGRHHLDARDQALLDRDGQLGGAPLDDLLRTRRPLDRRPLDGAQCSPLITK
jgi:hypothetical protein